MANFAQIKNNIVEQIIVVSDLFDDGQAWCIETYGGIWVDGTNANVGWTYNGTNFIAPQPYPSWALDENNDWQPPTPKPYGNYYWDETQQTWVEYVEQKN
jgi:hypothetical protein